MRDDLFTGFKPPEDANLVLNVFACLDCLDPKPIGGDANEYDILAVHLLNRLLRNQKGSSACSRSELRIGKHFGPEARIWVSDFNPHLNESSGGIEFLPEVRDFAGVGCIRYVWNGHCSSLSTMQLRKCRSVNRGQHP